MLRYLATAFRCLFVSMLLFALTSSLGLARSSHTPVVTVASAKPDPGQKQVASKVQVTNAWVRLPPPGSQMVAVYLTIANQGATVAQLNKVKVDGAMSSDLHETSIDQAGVSSMRMVSSLEIAPGESKSLAPGGLHVMVTGLSRHLLEGDKVNVSLLFKDHAPIQVTAVVKP